ncbi:MAG: leucine-rich repeat protein [Bacilli bacterium]|nr:leucine-rich repeat protein [Bacilli bacterium]
MKKVKVLFFICALALISCSHSSSISSSSSSVSSSSNPSFSFQDTSTNDSLMDSSLSSESSENESSPFSDQTTSEIESSKDISSEVTSEETSSDNTSSEVISEDSSSKVSSEDSLSENTSEISSGATSEETSSEESSEDISSEESSKDISSEESSEVSSSENTSEISSEETSKDTSDNISSEATSEETSSEESSEDISSEVSSEDTSSETDSSESSSEEKIVLDFTMDDQEVVYDGEEHNLYINEEVPSDVEVIFDKTNLINAGEYLINAYFYSTNDNYILPKSISARLTITKRTFDSSKLIFEDEEFFFDGAEKNLQVKGDLPKGLEVVYVNNNQTDCGEYEVIATFDGKGNFEEVNPLKATMTIKSSDEFEYNLISDEYKIISIVDYLGTSQDLYLPVFKEFNGVRYQISRIQVEEKKFANVKNVYYQGSLLNWCQIEFSSQYSNPMFYATNFYLKNESDDYLLIKELVIPNDTLIIGDYQFYGFTQIESLTLHQDITKIKKDAFYSLINLKDVYYLGDIVSWCGISFSSQSSNPMNYAENYYIKEEDNFALVEELVIPEEVTIINPYQFVGLKQITKLEIGNNVTKVLNSAFKNCSNVETIIFGSGLISFGDYSFYGCLSLQEISLNDGFKKIGKYCFTNCSAVITITLPASLTTLGYACFDGLNLLEEVYYKQKIVYWSKISIACESSNPMCYAKRLYHYDSNKNFVLLNEVSVASSLTKIGKFQFYGFNTMTSITIHAKVTSIQIGAFGNCTNLKTVKYAGSREKFNMISLEGETSSPMYYANHFYAKENSVYVEVNNFTINNVDQIGKYQYLGFTLNYIVLYPIERVNYSAFKNCSLDAIYFKGTIDEFTSIIISLENEVFKNAKVYIYSEEEPTDNLFSYWHYDDEGTIVLWG